MEDTSPRRSRAGLRRQTLGLSKREECQHHARIERADEQLFGGPDVRLAFELRRAADDDVRSSRCRKHPAPPGTPGGFGLVVKRFLGSLCWLQGKPPRPRVAEGARATLHSFGDFLRTGPLIVAGRTSRGESTATWVSSSGRGAGSISMRLGRSVLSWWVLCRLRSAWLAALSCICRAHDLSFLTRKMIHSKIESDDKDVALAITLQEKNGTNIECSRTRSDRGTLRHYRRYVGRWIDIYIEVNF